MPASSGISVKKVLLVLVPALLVVGSAGSSVYFYKQVQSLKANPQAQAQAQADAVVSKVSQLIVLPTDEKPTVATVTDPSKLKDQPFFANAKAGDEVLLYTNAKKAVLYDPTANKIVDVAPINLGAGTGATAAPVPTTSGSAASDSAPADTSKTDTSAKTTSKK